MPLMTKRQMVLAALRARKSYPSVGVGWISKQLNGEIAFREFSKIKKELKAEGYEAPGWEDPPGLTAAKGPERKVETRALALLEGPDASEVAGFAVALDEMVGRLGADRVREVTELVILLRERHNK
jgi:hypothetical protein